jgi:hypothetical protein
LLGATLATAARPCQIDPIPRAGAHAYTP